MLSGGGLGGGSGGGGGSQLKPALCAIGRKRGVSQLYCRKSRLDGPHPGYITSVRASHFWRSTFVNTWCFCRDAFECLCLSMPFRGEACGRAASAKLHVASDMVSLSDPTEIPPPLSRDRCSNTPVALCFLWYRRLSLLHPHFFP